MKKVLVLCFALTFVLCSLCFGISKRKYVVTQNNNKNTSYQRVIPNHLPEQQGQVTVEDIVATSTDHEEWHINYILNQGEEDQECLEKQILNR